MEEQTQHEKERREYAQITGDEDLRDRLNKHSWLDVSLWSRAEEVEALVDLIAHTMLETKPNKKRLTHLRVILMNLLRASKEGVPDYVTYYRKYAPYSKRPARYNPAGITRLTVNVIDDLINAGLIEHHRGQYSVEYDMGYCSKMAPTDTLLELMDSAGIIPEMVGRHPDSEVVLLRDSKETEWNGTETIRTGGSFINYTDDIDIEVMRDEINSYNGFLNHHDVRVPGLPKPEFTGVHRIFNNASWEQGGRFAGGWWMLLKKDVRKGIQIDHKPTIELDFSSSLLSILYAVNGIEPTGGDQYHLDGFDRDIVKKASMRCLNNKRRYHAINGLERDLLKDYPDIADSVDCERLITAFEKKHELVANDFYSGMGYYLMYLESEICFQVMMDLMEQEICCLSIHDSFIVQKEHRDELWSAMVDAFRDILNVAYTPVIK